MKLIKYSPLLIALILAGCGDSGSNQSNQSNQPKDLLPFKISGLQRADYPGMCYVNFESTNNADKTLAMTINVVFKTKENHVIEAFPRVITVRPGQTISDKMNVKEDCSVIGSMALNDISTCKVDGQFVNNNSCWNQFSPQPGAIPVIK